MTEGHAHFNFRLKEKTYLSRFRKRMQRLPFVSERPDKKVLLEYVAGELQRQIPEKPAPTETPLKVDFSWKNHLYVVGKVKTGNKGKSFGGELIWMPEEKDFRGALIIRTPDATKSPLDLTKDPRWLEYDHHIKLYQYYLDIALKANMFFYGITGGILAFIYDDDGKVLKFILALLLPVLMSFSFAVVFLYGAYKWREVTFTIRVLKRELGIKRAPDVQILSIAFLFFGCIFIIVFAALILVIIGWRFVPS
jgi:hypothetical protein